MLHRVALISLLLLLSGVHAAGAQDDWQYWHSYQLKMDVAEPIQLRVDGEQRLRDNFSDSFLANVQAGFLWKLNRYFDAGPFFKYERSKDSKGRHTNENRWLIEANLKADWKQFRLKNRHRIAYRNRNTFDSWRYRNQLRLSYVIPVKAIKLEPFASEEIFYESDDAFNQNRVQLGASTHLNDHLSLTLYYMLKSNRSGTDWNEVHVLGSALTVTL